MNDLIQRCQASGLAMHYTDYRNQRVDIPAPALERLLGHIEALDAAGAQAPSEFDDTLVVRQAASQRLQAAGTANGAGTWTLQLELGADGAGAPASSGSFGKTGIDFGAPLPTGYHRLVVVDDDGARTVRLVVCPERCYEQPRFVAGERLWGLTVQLYALRSRRNWGVGDFTDLATQIGIAADARAAFIGLNPMHAMFPGDPGRRSPYSPSNRQFLNVVYLDIEAIDDFVHCATARAVVAHAEFQAALARLRATAEVEYTEIGRIKLVVLALLYSQFAGSEQRSQPDPRQHDLAEFVAERGDSLAAHAEFEARFPQAGAWPQPGPIAAWLGGLLSPQDLAGVHQAMSEPRFYEYLQWQAHVQLQRAAGYAQTCGLDFGLFLDVAVGASPDGSEIASNPTLYARALHVGTPSEEFNPRGQDWGFPPMAPRTLKMAGYQPFVDILRANMRYASIIRIDHAMSLQRLFCTVEGAGAAGGAYLMYDVQAMLGILALESQRNHCMVVGEALGTVPDGFRQQLADNGVLSYSVLFFERDGAGFLPPSAWPESSFGVVRTHDHATFTAWWDGEDIGIRERLGLYSDPAQAPAEMQARIAERAALYQALARENLVAGDGAQAGATATRGPHDAPGSAPLEAVHRFVAQSRSELIGVALEDVLRQVAPINVPGTSDDQNPNWVVKVPVGLEELATDPRWLQIETMMRERSSRN